MEMGSKIGILSESECESIRLDLEQRAERADSGRMRDQRIIARSEEYANEAIGRSLLVSVQ